MDHCSNQEVLGSLMSFSEKVYDKGSEEAGETMVEFNKHKNKEGMFENDTVWNSAKTMRPGEWWQMSKVVFVVLIQALHKLIDSSLV